tara:strand:- start:2615 stop:3199 length:585 start_codon:yes stop_codon:yes gene_type:complete
MITILIIILQILTGCNDKINISEKQQNIKDSVDSNNNFLSLSLESTDNVFIIPLPQSKNNKIRCLTTISNLIPKKIYRLYINDDLLMMFIPDDSGKVTFEDLKCISSRNNLSLPGFPIIRKANPELVMTINVINSKVIVTVPDFEFTDVKIEDPNEDKVNFSFKSIKIENQNQAYKCIDYNFYIQENVIGVPDV